MRAALRRPARVIDTPAADRLRAGTGDGGFALLESMVAITLITIVMAALGTFYIRAVGSTNVQRARQLAVHIADGAVDNLRSYPPSDLKSGRGTTAVNNQFNNAPAVVAPWLQTMTPVYDSTCTSCTGTDTSQPMPTVAVTNSPACSNPAVPCGKGTTYSVMKYLGACQVPQGATNTNCTGTNNGVQFLRAVVSVSWPNARCSGGTCYYITSTLFTNDPDPTFNLNQLPRPAPIIVNPGAQSSMVGDAISLQLQVQSDTGVPTYTWSSTSTFPSGITLSPSGMISGSPTASTATLSITVKVTDAFLQTATATFTWTVVAKLAVGAVADRTATTGTAITAFTLTASGGNGGPYTWADPQSTLPPGLAVGASTGQLTGTPTTPGTYAVQIQVKDSGGAHAATVSWTWTVYAPLVLTSPGDQAVIVSTALNPLTMATSGGSGSFTWSLSGALPTGVTFSAGQFTGTPTVQGTWSVTVTLTDTVLSTTRAATFNWYVVPPLLITGGTDQISTVGTALTGLTLSASGGGGAPYTWSDPNGTLPPGLSISTTATYQGKVTGTPTTAGSYPVRLKTTDTRGVVVWTTFTWTVYPAVVLTSPGNQSSTVNTAITGLQVSVSGGSGAYTWASTGLPTGLALSTIGRITGTPSVTGTYSVSITVTDGITGQAKNVAFTWLVAPKPTVSALSNQTTTTTATITGLQLTTSCQNAPCTYTLNNGPAGLSINATGAIGGTVTSAPQVFGSVSVTVRDAAGVTATSGNFSWTILGSPTVNSPGNRVTTQGAVINVPLSSVCPNSPCTYTLNSGPTNLSVNASGTITGTVGAPAQNFPTVSVTIRDAAGVTGTSATFSWLVNAPLTMSSPGNQTTYVNTNASIDLTTLDNFGTAPYTYGASGLPSWLSVNATTGVLSGKAPAGKGTTTNITVWVTDAAGVTATSASFTWYVTDLKLSFADPVSAPSSSIFFPNSVSVDLDSYTTGGTGPYSFTIQNKPSWLTYSTTYHTLTGNAPTSVGNYSNIIITVSDSTGASITNPATTWHVSTIAWSTSFSNRTGKVGTAVSQLAAGNYDSGGVAPITFFAANLPPGVTINSSTGLVSGTPTAAGTYYVTLTISDSLGAWANSNTFSWTISP